MAIIVPVKNVTSCFYIDLCQLCGSNPRRGVCFPEYGLSRCVCFVNENNPSRPYTGDLCEPQDAQTTIPTQQPTSSTEQPTQIAHPSNWTPIIIGIVAGLAGLLSSIICCLWAVSVWRRRLRKPKE